MARLDAYMQGMCRDRAIRTARVKAGDASALDGGVWYGNDCHDLWTRAGKIDELMQMKKKGWLYHGNAPTSHWKKPKDDTRLFGRAFCVFQLKRESVPSEALEAPGVWVLDCRTTIELARMKALRAEIPFFNEIFAPDGPTPLQIGERVPGGTFSPLLPLLSKRKVSSFDEVRPGDWIGVRGGRRGCVFPLDVPVLGGKVLGDRIFYNLKHVDGEEANYNVLCMGGGAEGPRLLGFGLDPKGESPAGVSEAMRRGYNEAPIMPDIFLPPEKMDKHIAETAKMRDFGKYLAKHTMTEAEFKAQGGGELANPSAVVFNVDRVAQLAAVKTPDEGKVLMTRWVVEFRRERA